MSVSPERRSDGEAPQYEAGDRVVLRDCGIEGTVVRVHDTAYEVLLDSPKGVLATVPFEQIDSDVPSFARTFLQGSGLVSTPPRKETLSKEQKEIRWGLGVAVFLLLIWSIMQVM